MRHCNMLKAEWGMGSIRIAAAIAVALLLSAAPQAHAGAPTRQLNLIGGTGVPGGTVSVMVTLSNDPDSTATSADIDFTYPDDLVTFSPPVTTNCSIADRLADTHEIAGTLVNPGFLRLSFLVKGTPVEFPPLGDGELGSCDFQIEESAPAGTTAALIPETGLLFAGLDELSTVTMGGDITVSGPISPTPTATGTPVGTATATVTRTGQATATRTNTPPTVTTPTSTVTSGTPSATATNTSPTGGTATATNTPGTQVATATRTNTSGPAGTSTATRAPTGTPKPEDDGCNITPSGQSSSAGTLALLLAPALLIWARRRRF